MLSSLMRRMRFDVLVQECACHWCAQDAMVHAGVVKVPGLMPPGCKMFDTPGVPHDFQLSSRLTPEEVMLQSPHLPQAEFKPD